MAPRDPLPAPAYAPGHDSSEHFDAFSCTLSAEDDRAIVRLSGELDIAGVPTLFAQVGPLSAQFPRVVLDLSGLEFCDSSGLHAFVRLHRDAREHGSQLVLRSMTPAVERVFELTATAELLQATPTDGSV